MFGKNRSKRFKQMCFKQLADPSCEQYITSMIGLTLWTPIMIQYNLVELLISFARIMKFWLVCILCICFGGTLCLLVSARLFTIQSR